MRPDELQDLHSRAAHMWMAARDASVLLEWERLAIERHYELRSLPGVCEAIARHDWDAIDKIAERFDY